MTTSTFGAYGGDWFDVGKFGLKDYKTHGLDVAPQYSKYYLHMGLVHEWGVHETTLKISNAGTNAMNVKYKERKVGILDVEKIQVVKEDFVEDFRLRVEKQLAENLSAEQKEVAQKVVEQAAEKACGSVMGSDAFFPMPDTVEAAAAAGITAIIQPGGSIKDALSIEECNKHNIAMVFTGKRHFKH